LGGGNGRGARNNFLGTQADFPEGMNYGSIIVDVSQKKIILKKK
jgi:hypothetical protein